MGVSVAQWAVYISYIFVIVAYAVKVAKVASMPLHLRWELYPVIHEKGYKYGGSYFEEVDWWTKRREKSTFRSILYLLKNYLFFGGYFRRSRGYWLWSYPWHIGFYLIVLFHVLVFFGAVATVTGGISVSAESASILGIIIYYLTLVVAVGSFVTGSIGSIGLLVKRLVDKDLKDFTAPADYFGYSFFLVLFVSGLIAWYHNPALTDYRDFWKGLITFTYVDVELPTYIFIMLFALHLIHLPFTRSTHYITKLIAFFGVRWDDISLRERPDMAQEVGRALSQPVSWSAPHIQSGKTWGEVVTNLPGESAKTRAK